MEIVRLRILIAGDSFAAEWPGNDGWVKLLSQKFPVTNVAQAGVGEYKILKQLKNFDDYEIIIVSHTSPSRVHTPKHPLHIQGLHKDCDLLYNDIDRTSLFNSSLTAAKGYFKYHYDDVYQCDIYKLIRQEIYNMLQNKIYISMSHIDIAKLFIYEDNHLDFSEFWQKNKGNENHYTKKGNEKIFNIVLDRINKSVLQ